MIRLNILRAVAALFLAVVGFAFTSTDAKASSLTYVDFTISYTTGSILASTSTTLQVQTVSLGTTVIGGVTYEQYQIVSIYSGTRTKTTNGTVTSLASPTSLLSPTETTDFTVNNIIYYNPTTGLYYLNDYGFGFYAGTMSYNVYYNDFSTQVYYGSYVLSDSQGNDSQVTSLSIVRVPEPGTLALLGIGLLGLGASARRKSAQPRLAA